MSDVNETDHGERGSRSSADHEHEDAGSCLSHDESPCHANDVWRVQLDTGEIRAMSLDALDRAYDEGLIDERTPVLAPFAPAWATLGIVAGLEDTQPDLTPSLSPVALTPPPLPTTTTTTTDRPVAFDTISVRDLDLDLPEAAELRPRRGLVIGVVATSVAGLIAVPLIITNMASMPADVDMKANGAAALPPPAAAPAVEPVREPAAEPKEKLPTPSDLKDEHRPQSPTDADKAREKAKADEAARAPAIEKTPEEKAAVERAAQAKATAEKAAQEKAAAEKAAQEKAAAAKTTAAERPAGQPAEKPAQAPTSAPKRKAEKAAPALLNGGDRFDPLNGAL